MTALLERQSTDLRSTDECQWEAERRGASVIGQSGDLNVTLVSDQLQPPTFARTAGFVCNQRCHVLSAPENIANAGKKYFTDQQMVVFVCFCPVYLTCSGATLVVRLRGVSVVNHPSAFIFGCESSPISRNVRSCVRLCVRPLVDKCKIRLNKNK